MRILLVMLVACGTSSDPHEVVTCDSGSASASLGQVPPAGSKCELACEKKPTTTGTCNTPDEHACPSFVDDSGDTGCCVIPPTITNAYYVFEKCTS